jgi:hypothetical protein
MNNGKARIENRSGNYTITIPSKKNWFLLILGTIWMGGWYWGFANTLAGFESDDETSFSGFITFWLIGWTAAGITVVVMLLWGFFGKETLEFSGNKVKLQKTVFGIGIKKKLERSEVKNFRFDNINQGIFGGNRWAIWGMGPGKIKFDYGFKTYSFGLAVDEAEAKYLTQELNKKIE